MKIQVLSILILVGMILFPPADTPEDVPPMIVFSSNRGGDPNVLELYLLDPETLEITPLETEVESPVLPKWSPDGSQILFSIPGIWNLYTLDIESAELTQLTDFRSNNADWSPDGSQIVFQSDHQNEPEDTPDIYIMNIDGENLIEILDDPEVLDISPRWSPDGEKILYLSTKSGNMEIHTMNVDGSDSVQVTELGTPILSAAWSPDGERIAIISAKGAITDLSIIDKDGSADSLVQLTDDEDNDANPAWSPDGEKIVFRSDRSGHPDLWMINVDGTDLVQLTDDEYFDDFADWGP
jgi:TolB protein